MLACYGIPCSFTKVLKTHNSVVWYYVQNAVSRGILSLVLWSQDIVPLAEMMTRSRASSVVVPVRLEIPQRLVFPNPDWITERKQETFKVHRATVFNTISDLYVTIFHLRCVELHKYLNNA